MAKNKKKVPFNVFRKGITAGALGIAMLFGGAGMLTACGEKGDKGDTGASGKSAYELAVEQGFQGTLTEWLESLKGQSGGSGSAGNGIVSVEKTGTNGLVDTYTITFTDGSTTTFTITNGENGTTPNAPEVTINAQGYWEINGTPTSTLATAEDGKTPYIDGEYWYIDGTSTGVKAQGAAGNDGKSAFDLYKEQNPTYTGTLAEWLETLKGQDGKDGSMWFTGTLVTGTGDSIVREVTGTKVGDLYLNTSTSDIYECTATSTWKWVTNIKGENGKNGTMWHSGAGEPSPSVGVDGDFYYDADNHKIYIKLPSGWFCVSTIESKPAPVVMYNDGIPASELGSEGDVYIDTDALDMYKKISDTQWEKVTSFAKGTKESPIAISSATELVNAAQSEKYVYYKLNADINLNDIARKDAFVVDDEFMVDEFYGEIDGKGHTITMPTHAKSDSPGNSSWGVFAQYFNGTLKNVELDYNVNGYYVNWAYMTSKVTTFENVTTNGTVVLPESTGNYSPFVAFVGADITFKNCTNNVDVTNIKYGAAFIGGSMYGCSKHYRPENGTELSSTNSSGIAKQHKLTFINCVNNGDLYGEQVGVLYGNSSRIPLMKVTQTEAYFVEEEQNLFVEGLVNNGNVVGTKSSGLFCGMYDMTKNTAKDRAVNQYNEAIASISTGGELCRIDSFEGLDVVYDEETREITITNTAEGEYTYRVDYFTYLGLENGTQLVRTEFTATTGVFQYGYYEFIDKEYLDSLPGKKTLERIATADEGSIIITNHYATLYLVTNKVDESTTNYYYYLEVDDGEFDYFIWHEDRHHAYFEILVNVYDTSGKLVGQKSIQAPNV